MLAESVTDTPPAGAGALSVTVPVEDDPPVTEVGLRLTLPIVPCPAAGGVSVSVADRLLAEAAAMVAEIGFATGEVDTVKVPLL